MGARENNDEIKKQQSIKTPYTPSDHLALRTILTCLFPYVYKLTFILGHIHAMAPGKKLVEARENNDEIKKV